MKRSLLLSIILLIGLLVFCKNLHTKTDITIANKEPDTVKCIETVKNFLLWYRNNYDEINKIQLLKRTTNEKDAPFRIDYKNVDRYFNILKSSGYFTDDYFKILKIRFDSIDKKLVETKQNDGPVEGLDGDLFLYSQEPNEWLNNITKLEFNVIESNEFSQVVIIKFVDLKVLYKLNTKCLILCISPPIPPCNLKYKCP